MNNILVSLGSNVSQSVNILNDAILKIKDMASEARFSSVYETDPEGEHKHSKYKNCIGEMSTNLDYDNLKDLFKNMEVTAGRKPEMKINGIVPLDIDIVIWNQKVIRPKDLSMEYIKQGLMELSEK
ncbi:MAG: 2-amino-4-hydroxy-6-hydroxymethyldihydropteridine diphosphokinase [Bacteroidales bacterium]|nr:2-amino-4-hydroxy-6-hydroxymethyldihydropteridine diphosphokinase [Bacteroidales bacterium]